MPSHRRVSMGKTMTAMVRWIGRWTWGVARGDVCEQGGYGICGGVCVDLVNDNNNCGQCGIACPADLDCIDGLCGGFSCRVLQDVHFIGPNGGQVNVDTRGQPQSGTSCGGGGPQSAIVITIPASRTVTVETSNASYDTYMHLRSECDDAASTIACNDDGGAGLHSRISQRLEAGTYYAIIDGFAGRSGTHCACNHHAIRSFKLRGQAVQSQR